MIDLYEQGWSDAKLALSTVITDLNAELTRLRAELAKARNDAATLADILALVPKRPAAITYERGWEIIDAVQLAAIAKEKSE